MFHTIGTMQSEDRIVKEDQSNSKLSWSVQVSDDGCIRSYTHRKEPMKEI